MSYTFNPFTGNLDVTPFSLDGAGKIPSDYLPSYVDDVVEYDDLAGFPGTGETGKIYVAKDTGYTYRWTGSVYVRIGSGGEVELNLGSAGSPSLFFNGDANTGLYSPGADQVAISTNGSERLRIDSSGNVGIGTTSASSLLTTRKDISSATSITAANSQVGIFSGSGTGVQHRSTLYFSPLNSSGNGSPAAISTIASGNTNSSLAFYTNGANNYTGTPVERLRIDSSGRVGIGTTSPGNTLEISREANHGITLARPAGGVNPGNFKLEVSSNGAGNITADNNLALSTGSFQQFVVNRGATESFRIDSSGRLLVGTSSARLHASGTTPTLQVEGSSGALSIRRNIAVATALPANFFIGRARGGAFEAVTSGDYLGKITFTGADGSAQIAAATIEAIVDGTPGANDMPGRLVFSTTADGASSATERMRITSDGNVLIGKTSSDFTANGCEFSSTGGVFTRTAEALTINRQGSNGTAVVLRRSNVTVGSISVTTSATAYNTSSDYRLKENVVPLTGAVDRVNQLQVHRFNFLADPDKTVDGFIAHEAQAVVPECATGTKDEVDDEGNPVYQGIDQSKLVPLLTAALQEAIAKIETLEQRLTDAGIA